MSKFSRVIVLVVGLMSVFAAMAGAASATTWSNAGDTAFTATTGPMTLVAGTATLNCAGGTLTGIAPATQAGPQYVIGGNATFRPCTLSIFNPQVTCTYQFRSTGPPSTGVTPGTFTWSCRDSAAGCVITGAIPGSYTNSTAAANGFFRVRGTTGLTVQPGCILSGSGRLTPDPMTITAWTGFGGHLPFRFGPLLTQP